MERTERNGFTLVEILVVVTIIAIVAALTFPIFASAKRSSKGTVEISNMKQVYMALTMYEEDSAGKSPLVLGEVRSYTTNDEVFASPLDVFRKPMTGDQWTATPFVPCSGLLYPHKISFGYLRQFTPYDEDDALWTDMRQNAIVGIIASPWLGHPDRTFTSPLQCGDSVLAVAGPTMNGPIQRIQMDGSLYRLPARKNKTAFGAGVDDLFFNR
jgi:prepilin-type N-terminal cleavage/methylation domain-containing protein